MSIGPLLGIAGSYIESLFANSTGSPSATAAMTGIANNTPQDSNQLSPFAQILSSLQNLAQSNPSQYQQVTQQISGNLQSAAQTATANGDTSLASELTKLAGDFSSASGSGQLPNIQDLAQAIGGHHGHHHHFHSSSSSNTTETTSNSATGSGTTSTPGSVSSLLQTLNPSQASLLANNSLNPLTIIENTLSSAGIQGF